MNYFTGSEYTQVRNYSLSDEPSEDRYRITVKKEVDGVASSYLHDKVVVGDVLEVGVPCGDFVLTEGSQSLVYLGAGVGITPLLSMMKVSAKQDKKVRFSIQRLINIYFLFRTH